MSRLGHFRLIQPVVAASRTIRTGSRDNSQRDDGRAAPLQSGKNITAIVFSNSTGVRRELSTTLVDDGRAASSVWPRTHRDRLAPEECRSPGASRPLAPAESRGGNIKR